MFGRIGYKTVEGNAGPGGPIVQSMKASNALDVQNLQKVMMGLKNKYYGPMQDSIRNYKNALTNRENTMTPLLAQHQGLVNQEYVPNMNSIMGLRNSQRNRINTLLPYDVERQKLFNHWYPLNQQANINYKNSGGAGGGVAFKNRKAFEQAVIEAHPEWSADKQKQAINADLLGQKTFPDGTPLPSLTGEEAQTLWTVKSPNLSTVQKTKLSNLDGLIESIKHLDIESIKAMASPAGRAKLIYNEGKMFANPNDPDIDPMARRVISAMQDATLNMDNLRQSLGTSVIPDYVISMFGQLTNYKNPTWMDATQLDMNYRNVLKHLEGGRNELVRQLYQGLTTTDDMPDQSNATPNPTAPNTTAPNTTAASTATPKVQKSTPTKVNGNEVITIKDSNGDTQVIYRKNLSKALKVDPDLVVMAKG